VLEVLTTEAEAKVLSGASGVMRRRHASLLQTARRITSAPKPPTPAATWFAGLHTLAESSRSGNLISYNFGNTNWVPLMRRNTSFIIHPEEVVADNFALLMEWRSTGVLPPANPAGFPVNDVNLLVAIQDVLASGWRK
jgi:hypothetical protein